MEKTHGKIPDRELIKVESGMDQWKLFSKGLISTFSTSGIIQIHAEKKIRIEIEVLKILSPEMVQSQMHLVTRSSLDPESTEGVRRAQEYFHQYIDKSIWYLFGYIKGAVEIPICILYYELFGTASYAIKFQKEKEQDFFPRAINPELN